MNTFNIHIRSYTVIQLYIGGTSTKFIVDNSKIQLILPFTQINIGDKDGRNN